MIQILLTFNLEWLNLDKRRNPLIFMKRIIVLLICLGITCFASSQDNRSERKARKEERKAEMISDYTALGISLEKKKFVVEMEYLLNESGNTKRLNQLLNFIMVDSSTCVWESELTDIFTDLMKNVSRVEGIIDDWKMVNDIKRLRYFLQFKMFTDNGLYHVTVSINPDKTVSGTITAIRDRLNFSGRIVIL